MQALTTLNLPWNQIGAEGAQYLAEALRNNSVRDHQSFFFFFFLYSIISLFSISYRHSLHSTFTTIKSEIKVHNIWLKHYETIQWEIITPSHSSSSFIPSVHMLSFHTDTHYTRPWRESNRRSRCKISGWSITAQFSEWSSFLLLRLLHLFIIALFFFLYRHSPRLTFPSIKSEIKVENIWLKWKRKI